MIAVFIHPFQYGRAQSSCTHSVFHSDDAAESLAYFFKEVLIQRFQETHVVMSCILHFIQCSLNSVADRTYRKDGYIFSVADFASGAHFHLFQRTTPVHQNTLSSGITDDECSLSRQLGRVHQFPQLMLVHRRGNRQIRYGAECCQIEGAMMCGTVFTHQSCTVEADDNGEIQDGEVMNDIVVGALGESTVDVAERQQPVLCHSAGERHGMAFGNTHVEGALRHLLHHDVHRTSCWHGRSHSHYLWILFCEFKQGFAKYLLEFRRLVLTVFTNTFTSIYVKFSGCMPDGCLVFCRCITISFLRVQMEQLRTFHILQLTEQAHDFLHIMTVKGTEVTDVHALEDILLMRDGTFHGIAQSDKSLSAVFFQITIAVQPFIGFIAQFVIGLAGVEVDEIFLHTSHRTVYRHVVVVEDDEQVVGR